jgi:hypothetical protein
LSLGVCQTAFAEQPAESFASQEAKSCLAQIGGCFLDHDGRWKSPEVEYQRRLESRQPFHLLTIGELGIILGSATVWYVADRERNVADWDFPSWQQRFTLEAWRFDNNEFPINFVGHPVDGVLFYTFPRANDHSLAVASAYSFVASFIWEFFIEFKEKVSVNDLITTLGSGVTMGEFGHKFVRYFSGVSPNAHGGHDVANATLGFPVAMSRALSGRPQGELGPYDDYGFSSHIGARLSAGYLFRQHDFGDIRNSHGFSAGGRLSSIPGEGLPGRSSLFYHEADITELWIKGGGGNDAREIEIESDTQLLGMYFQDLNRSADGSSGTVALNLAYRYLFQDFEGYNDRLGLLRLPGIGADYRFTKGGIGLSTRVRLNPDFAGLHAPIYPLWQSSELEEGEVEKTILRKHGYYYAWGYSSRVGGSLHLGPLVFHADLEIGSYNSQEDLDRTQEDISHDVDLRDTLFEVDTKLSLRIPTTPIRLDLGWSSANRNSTMGDLFASRNLSTWSLGINLLR